MPTHRPRPEIHLGERQRVVEYELILRPADGTTYDGPLEGVAETMDHGGGPSG